MATWLFEKFAPRRVAQPSEIALRKIAATPLPPGVGIERVWVNGEPVSVDAWLAQHPPLPMVAREVPWPPPPAVDNWIARSTPAEYELPELVAERQARVFEKNGLVHRFWNRRGDDLLFIFAVTCVMGAATALYFALENLGWFRL